MNRRPTLDSPRPTKKMPTDLVNLEIPTVEPKKRLSLQSNDSLNRTKKLVLKPKRTWDRLTQHSCPADDCDSTNGGSKRFNQFYE